MIEFLTSALRQKPIWLLRTLVFPCGILSALISSAQEPPPPQAPQISPRSEEGERALAAFKVPEGMKIELVAAEPDLANPVAFCIDEQGRFYVAETFRQGRGVEDNRNHGAWLDDDLAAQSIEDRLAYFQKHLQDRLSEYTRHDDRIRLLEDTTGDGVVDKATVFSDRYNGVLEGTGAGVLARRGDVFYTNIPHLWKLRDTNGDDRADARESLHTGYGVRVAFRGHDMHGLVIGPDGKLYYSIGDRGYNVKTEGKHWKDPSSGAVFRCNLDGSDLEVVATGLRNPQELAFDDFGNLFTGDNNSDSGDKARWVYVVEGGDSGWRMYYQYLGDRGPFNREQIWHPYHAGQPAYIVPPIANIGSGPSGLTYYPGTGLDEKYRGSFFLCDFRGGPGNSGVLTFKVKPQGAGFELADAEMFAAHILATDVDFGPDGAMYVSDWVNGWNGEGKGRIYRISNEQTKAEKNNQQARELISSGFTQRSVQELALLLAHPNRTVRQESQFALVEKRAVAELVKAAQAGDQQLARLHGIWGLGMLARAQASAPFAPQLIELLSDQDSEVRSQAAKVLGDARLASSTDRLLASLQDDQPRVRYFAAVALGKIGDPKVLPAVTKMLEENADEDPILRHGGIMALAGCGTDDSLAGLAAHNSPSVRLAAVVALRKRNSPAVAAFLHDIDPLVVLEAARAIYDDQPLEAAMPKLAALISRPSKSDPLMRRVLAANNWLGTPAEAETLARFAAEKTSSESLRMEALNLLKNWASPAPRDTVLGQWRPLLPRDRQGVEAAFRKSLPGILAASPKIRNEGVKLAASFGIGEILPALETLYKDNSQAGGDRADALAALVEMRAGEAAETIRAGLADGHPVVRTRARELLTRVNPAEALEELKKATGSAEQIERQGAWETLASFTQPGTNAIISQGLDELLAGKVPADTRLDLVLAAKRRADRQIAAKIAQYEKQAAGDDPAARFRDALAGGNAERGRDIFFHRTELSCVRCHRHGGIGGDVGPDLTKIGTEKQPLYLLEAIVTPNSAIAKGFEAVLIATDDGKTHTGIVSEETDKTLRLKTAEGKLISIEKESIEERGSGQSAMPADLIKHLNERDLRDLVEFLKN